MTVFVDVEAAMACFFVDDPTRSIAMHSMPGRRARSALQPVQMSDPA
jgi:hypothetical protein